MAYTRNTNYIFISKILFLDRYKEWAIILSNVKGKKIKFIIFLSICLFMCLTAVNVIVSYINTKNAVEVTVGNQGIETAKSIASSMDIDAYKRFLADPRETQDYWKIHNYLQDARKKTGVLYVYTLTNNDPHVMKGMIVDLPEKNSTNLIGGVSSVPPEQAAKAFKGETYYTGVIDDKTYGQYLSTGAPIKDEAGHILGYVGVDISVNLLDDIRSKVIQSSLASFLFDSIFALLLLSVFYFMQKWYRIEWKKEMGETEETYQQELRLLNNSVRSLRHDYLNHLQVLYGLLQLKNYEKANEYMASLVKEATLTNLPVWVENPALLSLLQTKWVTAQKHGIPLLLDIGDSYFHQIKTTDLIKILSNLIDNALDATMTLPLEKRRVEISCKAKDEHYVFIVTNTGPMIPPKQQIKIFQNGFSTKRKEANEIRGQGLFIVNEMVKGYEGTITVSSNEEQTTFSIDLPIRKK
ncbi:ATP-binding protein [Ectobacillus polymachus]|uniref:sensor histidine kinase n=1 Tax=Ectobacillus polymachus TaxID=1508806 RepID=UPI003A875945